MIATLARQGVEDGFDVRIVTSDKDARQLLGPNVKLFNVRKNHVMDEAYLLEDWGVRPDQVTDYQGLVGDTSDNIPGVPKIGPKTATELLKKYGTLEDVLAHAEEVTKKQVRENLIAFADQGRLSKRLATLNTTLPLEFDWDKAAVSPPDAPRLTALFTDLGFRPLRRGVPQRRHGTRPGGGRSRAGRRGRRTEMANRRHPRSLRDLPRRPEDQDAVLPRSGDVRPEPGDRGNRRSEPGRDRRPRVLLGGGRVGLPAGRRAGRAGPSSTAPRRSPRSSRSWSGRTSRSATRTSSTN